MRHCGQIKPANGAQDLTEPHQGSSEAPEGRGPFLWHLSGGFLSKSVDLARYWAIFVVTSLAVADAMNRMTLSILCLCLVLCLIPSVSASGVEHLKIDPVRDSMALPCRFDLLRSKVFWDSQRLSKRTGLYRAVRWRVDGSMGSYVAVNNWLISDARSGIVLYDDIGSESTIEHVNVPTSKISDVEAYHLDDDSTAELIVTYSRDDTAWVELFKISSDDSMKAFLATGEDRDGSGHWDGSAAIIGHYDVNGDGIEEIFFSVDTGYDLYPRGLVCLDWTDGSILWNVPLSSLIGKETFRIVTRPDGMNVITFEIGSKANNAVAGELTDRRSYMACASLEGDLLWAIPSGEKFTSAKLAYLDFDGDGYVEVLMQWTPEAEMLLCEREDDYNPEHYLQIIDLYGNVIRRMSLGKGLQVRCTQAVDMLDGRGMQIVVSFTDNLIRTYDLNLELKRSVTTYTSFVIVGFHNFTGDETREFFAKSDDSRMWILDADFEPLAQIGFAEPLVYPSLYPLDDDDRYGIIAGIEAGHEFRRMVVADLPWNYVFYRKPWLAFLAAFVPMFLIASFAVFHGARMRHKNRQISKARDDLDAALIELRDTQQKLVAAEKFREARSIAGGFAHEIRNALFPARGILSRMAQTVSGGESADLNELASHSRFADRSIAKAIELTTLITKYTRIESEYDPQRVLIDPVIRDVLSENRIRVEEMDVEVNVSGESDTEVVSNRKQLYSVLNNLLLNSLDALAQSDEREIEIRWRRSKENGVTLVWRDTGCGIPEENLGRVFESFFSTKPDKGTGIGLATVKKIIELYEGTVTVSSDGRNGAVFEITMKDALES